ncbi:uncharacterized protein LOC109708575 [Ananas comosus]|uniref:Uncharacterized protein LOC109708575 n=1 Tax=Ananas comosus TaxID=4615 RepID=A0A199UIR4_ANACO|nr:uncharacterized protein LOC109708575 [Ananas comosus]OAY64465.1 hypothetical protein ACMD2_04361 [Ananas comosus]
MELGTAAQMAVPVIGIVAAAAATFYAVSFLEIREKSFKELDESSESASSGSEFIRSSASSRKRRAMKKAEKEAKRS